jgi:hypothetical protein
MQDQAIEDPKGFMRGLARMEAEANELLCGELGIVLHGEDTDAFIRPISKAGAMLSEALTALRDALPDREINLGEDVGDDSICVDVEGEGRHADKRVDQAVLDTIKTVLQGLQT